MNINEKGAVFGEGFPEPMTYTPVPDSILGKFLEEFPDDHLLRCFLRILWHLHKSKDKIKAVDIATLDADAVMRSILSNRSNPDLSKLSIALKELYEFQLLLLVKADDDNENLLVMLNTQSNAKLVERRGWIPTKFIQTTRTIPVPSQQSNVFGLYEQNIGLITPLIADELRDMENEYPIAWVEEAVQLAVIYNRKSIRYISRILERWRNEGRDGGPGGNSQTVGAKDYIKRYGVPGS